MSQPTTLNQSNESLKEPSQSNPLVEALNSLEPAERLKVLQQILFQLVNEQNSNRSSTSDQDGLSDSTVHGTNS